MATFPQDEVDELRPLCSSITACEEGTVTYLVLAGVTLPAGCQPAVVDVMLCPTSREGYPSRLFFSEQVQCPFPRNWNFHGQICDRNWHAYSWKIPTDMRLAQMVLSHLDGLRRA